MADTDYRSHYQCITTDNSVTDISCKKISRFYDNIISPDSIPINKKELCVVYIRQLFSYSNI